MRTYVLHIFKSTCWKFSTIHKVREPTPGVSALGVERGSVLLEVGFVEPTDRRDRGVPWFVVPRHGGDVVGVHQPGPVRDERRDVVVAPLSEGVVVRATVRLVANSPLVHRGVGVRRVESVQYHFISRVRIFTARGGGGAP